MSDNKPVHVHRSGALSASIWQREHNDEVFYNVTVQRAWLDKKDTSESKEGTWKYSDSFGRDDLPVVSALTTRAWNSILTLENAAKERSAGK